MYLSREWSYFPSRVTITNDTFNSYVLIVCAVQGMQFCVCLLFAIWNHCGQLEEFRLDKACGMKPRTPHTTGKPVLSFTDCCWNGSDAPINWLISLLSSVVWSLHLQTLICCMAISCTMWLTVKTSPSPFKSRRVNILFYGDTFQQRIYKITILLI